MQLKAVKENGYAIKYIINPTEKVQLKAIKRNLFSIQYIRNPSKEAQKLAIINSEYHSEIFEFCPDFDEKDFKDEILLKRMLG